MDYIDWIISSVVFVTVIALVLISLFNILPKNTSNSDAVSDALYKSTISQTIPVYNVSKNTDDNEIYLYQITDISNGRAQNPNTIDGNINFGQIYFTDKFYVFDNNYNSNNNLGILLLEENFNDFDYLDTFVTSQEPEIKSGVLEVNVTTDLNTINEYSDYIAKLSTTSDDLIVYLSYTDINNNYFCKFTNSDVNLYSTISGEEDLIDSFTEQKIGNWRELYFGYYLQSDTTATAFCKTKNNSIESEDLTILKTKIILSPQDTEIYIDDFYIFKNKDIEIDIDANEIYTIDFKTNITDGNTLVVNCYHNNGNKETLYLYFNDELEINEHNSVAIIKDSNENTKSIFSKAKEFWINIKESEDINIAIGNSTNNFGTNNISGNLKYPDFITDTYLDYRVPLTFSVDSEISADTNITFDVNFLKAFEETEATGSDGSTAVYYCDEENSCTALDYKLINYSGIGSFTINLPIISTNVFNIYIYFSSQTISDVEFTLDNTEELTPQQLTAQIENEEIADRGSKFYLYNYIYSGFETEINNTIIFDVFDENSLFASDCNFTFKNNKIIIDDCENDSWIKIRTRPLLLDDVILEYPNLSITKTNERIITQEHFENLSCDSYFVNIKNKTLDLNCNTAINPSYKNITKYLHNNGLLENASIYVKSKN